MRGGPGLPAADAPPMTAAQRPTGRYQAVIGPWFHNPTTLGLTFEQLQLAWFDRWLKGTHDGIDRTTTPLHVFELEANRWIDAPRWPLPQPRAHLYRLGEGTGTLTWSDVRSPCNAGTDQWSTGLPAYVIAELGGSGDLCAQNDSTTQAGALTYTSAPFRTATTVAGPIDVTLYMTGTTPDAEIVADVEVVKPDGSSYPISSGALLGSLRALDPRLSWRLDGRLILPGTRTRRGAHATWSRAGPSGSTSRCIRRWRGSLPATASGSSSPRAIPRSSRPRPRSRGSRVAGTRSSVQSRRSRC
jgi:uncharacterized protein